MAAQVGNTTENIVLDDLFLVKEKDRDGKKFDKGTVLEFRRVQGTVFIIVWG